MKCISIGRAALIMVLVAALSSPAHAAVATFKEGTLDPFTAVTYTGTQDTHLLTQGGNSTDNFGARTDLSAGRRDTSGGGTAHGLMRFNITSMSGQFTSINSVKLRIYPDFVTTPVTETMEIHRVTAANTGWVEGTGTSFTGFGSEDVGGSTWNFRVQGSSSGTGTAWAGSAGASSGGTDFNTALLASNTFSSGTPLATAYELVFTDVSFIPTWASGTNEGLLFKIPNDTTFTDRRELGWSSSEESNVSLRPELIIDYNPVPEPGSLALIGGIMMLLARRR